MLPQSAQTGSHLSLKFIGARLENVAFVSDRVERQKDVADVHSPPHRDERDFTEHNKMFHCTVPAKECLFFEV